jgi:hypothetical protein
MRRPTPVTLEAAFLVMLLYVPMVYYAVRTVLAMLGM